MQIEAGVVVGGAFMGEILCCFTGAICDLVNINLHRM